MTEWGETWSDDESGEDDIESVMRLIEHYHWDGIIDKAEFILGLSRKEKNQLNLLLPSPDCTSSCLAHLVIQFDSDHELRVSDDFLRTTLFHFTQTNQLDSVCLMLHRLKVNPNLSDQNGNTACHLHAHTVQVLKEFNAAGADFGIANHLGQQPQHLAAGRNQSRLVTYMLSTLIANINSIDYDGESVLFYAVRLFIDRLKSPDELNHDDLIQLGNMLKSFRFGGADFARNNNGKSVEDLVLSALNAICVDDAIASIYDIYPTSDAPLIEFIVNVIFCIEKAKDETEEEEEKLVKIVRQFEHLDHTADIQVHAWGETLSLAFVNAALGMIDYMVPLERIEPRVELVVQSSGASSLKEFLFNFMQEVLYAAACEPYFMTRQIEVIEFNQSKYSIRAKLKGENFEVKRHGGEGTEVKAITYSAMRIDESEEKCEIWVIVDI